MSKKWNNQTPKEDFVTEMKKEMEKLEKKENAEAAALIKYMQDATIPVLTLSLIRNELTHTMNRPDVYHMCASSMLGIKSIGSFLKRAYRVQVEQSVISTLERIQGVLKKLPQELSIARAASVFPDVSCMLLQRDFLVEEENKWDRFVQSDAVICLIPLNGPYLAYLLAEVGEALCVHWEAVRASMLNQPASRRGQVPEPPDFERIVSNLVLKASSLLASDVVCKKKDLNDLQAWLLAYLYVLPVAGTKEPQFARKATSKATDQLVNWCADLIKKAVPDLDVAGFAQLQ